MNQNRLTTMMIHTMTIHRNPKRRPTGERSRAVMGGINVHVLAGPEAGSGVACPCPRDSYMDEIFLGWKTN